MKKVLAHIKRISHEEGFTLVELLAVMMVFGVISGIAGTILVTSLRTASKTTVVANVRHNGNFAISQMVKSIESAKNLVTPFPCVVAPSATPPPVKSITFTDVNGVALTYTCNDVVPSGSLTSIASDGASLIDQASVAVVPNSCYFTCSQTTKGDFPVIGINFSLTSFSASSFNEQTSSPIQFSTSIVFRNFTR